MGKKRYIIDVEGFAPVRIQFETWAEDKEEAIKNLNNPRALNIRQKPDIDISRMKRTKATIKDALTSLIEIVKNF